MYYSGYYEKCLNYIRNIEKYNPGGFRIQIEECLKSVPFEKKYFLETNRGIDECPYEDAMIFLDGACDCFAEALHIIFGYDIYESIKGRKHWFCICSYKGRNLYIDVRGATSDFAMFSARYGFQKNEIQLLNASSEFYNDDIGEQTTTGFRFAYAIIENNPHYYGFF